MSDLDNKVVKGSDLGESFSDLMKKVVEKQLEEENAVYTENLSETPSETPASEEKPDSDAIIKSEEAADAKAVEVPIFEWKEEEKPVVETYQPVSEVGVISTMTTINGTVSSKGHIRIEGNVIGDIFAYGDIKVTGKVAGRY